MCIRDRYVSLHFFGVDWVSLAFLPKFSFNSFNYVSTIEYQYLDTNEILFKKISTVYRLATFIYVSLEDSNIYFAVYEITPVIERQMVRNQRFMEYTEYLEIEYVIVTPGVILIIFYNKSSGEIIYTYAYFFNGPFIIGKSSHNLVIDDKRFALQLYEDKEMHWSFYKSLKEPIIYVDPEEKVKNITFKINNFFEIIGNLKSINEVEIEDPKFAFEDDDVEIIDPLYYKNTRKILRDLNINEHLKNVIYFENRVYFTINAKDLHTFSVFR